MIFVLHSWNSFKSIKVKWMSFVIHKPPTTIPEFTLVRWLLESIGTEVGYQGSEPCDRRVETFSPPRPQGWREGWMLNQSPMASDLIKHSYLMKSPLKMHELRGELLVWWTCGSSERVVPLKVAWKLCAPSHISFPMHLFHLNYNSLPVCSFTYPRSTTVWKY